MTGGEFKKRLDKLAERERDGIPHDIEEMLVEARREFPTIEKTMVPLSITSSTFVHLSSLPKNHIDPVLNEEREKWFRRWFGTEDM